MRHRIERVRCPVCRNSPVLRPICTGCNGSGEAIIVHHPNGIEIEIYPSSDEEMLRAMYPDASTPTHARTTVAQAWKNFAKAIGIAPFGLQHNEMKKSFYGGIAWFMEALSSQLDPDKEPTPDDLEYMQRVHAELTSFAERMR